jgi:hypothetical protein
MIFRNRLASIVALILIVIFFFPSQSKADVRRSLLHQVSFESTWSRYPSPDMIVEFMRRLYPHANFTNDGSLNECLALTHNNSNRTLLGDSVPALGKPVLKQPNGGFVNWYTKCVSRLILANFDDNYTAVRTKTETEQAALAAEDFSSNLRDECLARFKYPLPPTMDALRVCPWSTLAESTKMTMIRLAIHRFIGPDEIVVDLNLASDTDALAKVILEEIESFAHVQDPNFAFLNVPVKATYEEFSAYDAVKIAHFLTLMTEVLKY